MANATDERMGRSGNDRGPQQNAAAAGQPRGEDESRKDRAGIATMTQDDRRAFLRSEFLQQALPSPPALDGFHTCWLSTTNQYDTIARRVRLGYEPVKPSDIPGHDLATMKTGEYAGMIAVNEMLLYKIPQVVYEDMMALFHHELPNEQEEMLKANIELMAGGSLSKGMPLISEADMGDGTAELIKRRSGRAPTDWG